MTVGRFDGMSDQAERELARHLADVSEVLDFPTALKIVRFDASKAEELIRMREEHERREEERTRLRRRRELALRQDFG
jgi:hypothetical protein